MTMWGARQIRVWRVSQVSYLGTYPTTKGIKMKTAKAFFIAMLTAAGFIIYGLYFANPAGATPEQEHDAQLVCQMMNSYAVTDGGVTDQEITNILQSMLIDGGLTAEEGGAIVANATVNYCPEWQVAFVDYFTELGAGKFTIQNDGTVVYPSPATSRVGGGLLG